MSIKDIPMVEEVKSKGKQEIPVIHVDGHNVTRYVTAAAEAKALEETMALLGPELQAQGVNHVLTYNCCNEERVSSVKLEDGNGEQVMVTLQKKTTKFDSTSVKNFFDSTQTKGGLPVNPNEFLEWTLQASFDSSVLQHNGKFSQNRFDKFQAAMQVVCEELGLPKNPLSFGKVLTVKPAFHELRYTQLSVEDNLELQKLVPCVSALKPILKKQ